MPEPTQDQTGFSLRGRRRRATDCRSPRRGPVNHRTASGLLSEKFLGLSLSDRLAFNDVIADKFEIGG